MHVGGFKINRDPGRARPAWAIEEERQKEAKRQKLELSPEESCQIGCVGELYTVEHYEEALAYASMGGGQTLVVAVIVMSTLLNAAYFLPIIYAAFFRPPADDPHAEHPGTHDTGSRWQEAPLRIVIALAITATGTVLLFFLPDIPLTLSRQLAGVAP